MAHFRCWMYMNQGRQGWKESFYTHGTMPDALSRLGQLAIARALLLGDEVQLVRVLVCNEPPDRSYVSAGGPPAPGDGPAASPYVALVLRLEVGPAGLYHRNVYLRGLPQSWLKGPNLHGLTLVPRARRLIREYVAALASLGFCLKDNDKTSPCYPIIDVQPTVAGDDVEFLPSDWVIVTTSIASGLTNQDARRQRTFASVAGIHWLPAQLPGFKINGVVPILAVDGQQVLLGTNAPTSGMYLGGGFLQGRGTVFSPITGGLPLRMVQKDTGKALPFDGVAALALPLPRRLGGGQAGPGAGSERPFYIYPGPVVISGDGEINNALDMAALVFSGYPHEVLSIAVAPDLNHPGTYVVAIPGTNADTNASMYGAVGAAFQYPTVFSQNVLEAILEGVPVGGKLILSGHSQGGMVAQNLVQLLTDQGWPVLACVCYGSPVTARATPGVRYTFFQARWDPIPLLSAKGFFGNVISLAVLGLPLPILVPNDASAFNPIAQHNSYDRAPYLLGFDPVGQPLAPGTPPFLIQLGPITRHGVAVPPPEQLIARAVRP